MKKIFIAMSVAILIALCSAPSFVKAEDYVVGQLWYNYYSVDYLVDCYTTTEIIPVDFGWTSRNACYVITANNSIYDLYFRDPNTNTQLPVNKNGIRLGYIPTLSVDFNYSNVQIIRDYDTFVNALPEDLRPEDPSIAEQLWDDFYELYYDLFGIYPQPGSLYDLLRKLSLGDDSENTEIVYPTMTPSPTPTPTPTPIPVQTIFVPDGNGNTTIIYQYPDPTTGVITQSPYNPNIENNITVNCDCNGSGGSGSNTFGTNPQDPYTLTSSMFWADGFGVEISENPLTAANDSQKTLAEAASEYADSVNVASNSFNILPVKWLTLVGLLGGILIIAGLIRTFLGG